MSAPKKGKDLSALKARLAKKAGKAPSPEADQAEVHDQADSGDGAAVPAPGEVLEPEPEAAIPPPGQVADEPEPEPSAPAAPSSVQTASAAAAPAAASRPAPSYEGADLGGVSDGGGGLDGDIKQRSSMGLVAVAGIAAIAFGLAAGYLFGVKVNKSAKLKHADLKSREVAEEINLIKEGRSRVSLGMEDLKTAMGESPAKGAEAAAALAKHVEATPNAEKLFGWQASYMGDTGVKVAQRLYHEGVGLRRDIAELETFIADHGDALATGSAPLLLAVVQTDNGAQLVQAVQPMCGEAPCAPDKSNEATALQVRFDLTSDPQVVPISQAALVVPDGPIFKYAILDNPSRTAYDEYVRLMQQVTTRLETMNEVEKKAIKAYEDFGAGTGAEEG